MSSALPPDRFDDSAVDRLVALRSVPDRVRRAAWLPSWRSPRGWRIPVVQSTPPRTLFLITLTVTLAITIVLHELRKGAPSAVLGKPFFVLFAIYDYPLALVTIAVLMCTALVPDGVWFRRLLHWLGEHPRAIAAASGAVLCVGALLAYQNFPFSTDEYAPFFQSRVFAAGHLTGQLPPALLDRLIPPSLQPEFFNYAPASGRVASVYWPSFALLLTPFMWLGAPWACNPLISACTVLAIHRLALRLFRDVEAAGLAILLTVASPVFFANGMSYYSMSVHLLANSVYALLLIRPTPLRAFAAGVTGSVALTLHNPFPHLLFAIPWLVWIPLQARDSRRALQLAACLTAGYLPLSLVLGLGWIGFLQNLAHGANPVDHLSATAHRVGSTFSLPSLWIVLRRLAGFAKLILWAAPMVPALALMGMWKWRHDTRCRVLFASGVITLLGYFFFAADGGFGWGFRYFHSAWLVLPLFAAGALVGGSAAARAPGRADWASTPGSAKPAPQTPNAVRKSPVRPAHPSNTASESRTRSSITIRSDHGTRALVTAGALLSLILVVPFSAGLIHDVIGNKRAQEPVHPATGAQVVFINTGLETFDAVDLLQNDPFLREEVIRLEGRGAASNAQLIQRYFPGYRRTYADGHGEVWMRQD